MYSRRQFLQIAGITLAASQTLSLPSFLSASDEFPQGRALTALPVYRRIHQDAEIIGRLWPDSITTIFENNAEWYRVSGGYVQREFLQPVLQYRPQAQIQLPEQAFWAEVAAPVAAVREYCAADAPLITRIGHGGVAHVVDYLPDDWYGLADEAGNWIGWSQAIRWQPVESMTIEQGSHHLKINITTQTLTAWENDQNILIAPCSTDPLLQQGQYALQAQNPGGGVLAIDSSSVRYQGLPWLNRFGDGQILAGAYWHNRFGYQTPGTAVQVTPLLAHWLYNWLNNDSQIDVI